MLPSIPLAWDCAHGRRLSAGGAMLFGCLDDGLGERVLGGTLERCCGCKRLLTRSPVCGHAGDDEPTLGQRAGLVEGDIEVSRRTPPCDHRVLLHRLKQPSPNPGRW